MSTRMLYHVRLTSIGREWFVIAPDELLAIEKVKNVTIFTVHDDLSDEFWEVTPCPVNVAEVASSTHVEPY